MGTGRLQKGKGEKGRKIRKKPVCNSQKGECSRERCVSHSTLPLLYQLALPMEEQSVRLGGRQGQWEGPEHLSLREKEGEIERKGLLK